MIRQSLLCTLLACLSASAKDVVLSKPETVGMSPTKLARVEAATQKLVDRKKIAGAVTLVARKGKIVHFPRNRRARHRQRRADAARYDIPNLLDVESDHHRSRDAALGQGKFKLDDPVSNYLPEFKEVTLKNGDKPKREMTIRDLMRHTSGLSYGFLGAADYGVAGIGRRDRTIAEDITALSTLPLRCDPGSQFIYSVSTDVLGRLIEVRSTKRWTNTSTNTYSSPSRCQTPDSSCPRKRSTDSQPTTARD